MNTLITYLHARIKSKPPIPFSMMKPHLNYNIIQFDFKMHKIMFRIQTN